MYRLCNAIFFDPSLQKALKVIVVGSVPFNCNEITKQNLLKEYEFVYFKPGMSSLIPM